ncbi:MULTISPECIES: PadR family transcriptional regulator [Streptomyces]|jgi:DNA-binding PadR family transcriptional regulator|uniref:PadR family transcriptional regulator n=1 Tax=Streptomyces spinosisporus TaxID=2927582 RepID=A0ABS9XPQ8_9ACTN|nr:MULTISPECIES: PadR family transcriptional regulator [Streptomyces]MCI3244067.1 PadR family transcriptional regulator [Streptomyces spinosisporus]WUB41083.1 PadR family transcriptional regulator [Streptomyces sp. NBC_00588]
MSLTHALLGLLAVEPASGYDLTKEFEQDLGRYAWQAGHTSVYPELVRMAERGLVEVTEEGPRRRRTYSVTSQGREELRKWLLEPWGQGVVRNEQVLRMFLLEALEPEEAAAALRGVIEHAEQGVTQLSAHRAHRAEEPPEGRDVLGQLAAEYGLRQYQAMRDWALWALDHLNQRRTD